MRAREHTPTPWEIAPITKKSFLWSPSTGAMVASVGGRTAAEGMANEDFIVRAVNAHDDLLAALERSVVLLDAYNGMTLPIGIGEEVREVANVAREVIRRARGEASV